MSVPRRWSGGRSSPASLQRRLPFTDEDAADEDASQLSSHSSSRPLPLAIPRQRPASSSQNLSSSIGHRIPTRSFAHNASGSVGKLAINHARRSIVLIQSQTRTYSLFITRCKRTNATACHLGLRTVGLTPTRSFNKCADANIFRWRNLFAKTDIIEERAGARRRERIARFSASGSHTRSVGANVARGRGRYS